MALSEGVAGNACFGREGDDRQRTVGVQWGAAQDAVHGCSDEWNRGRIHKESALKWKHVPATASSAWPASVNSTSRSTS